MSDSSFFDKIQDMVFRKFPSSKANGMSSRSRKKHRTPLDVAQAQPA